MRKQGRLSRFRQSLLSRYLFIIMAALLFLPIIFPVSYIMYNFFGGLFGKMGSSQAGEEALYTNAAQLERMWHMEALRLKDSSSEEINGRLSQLSKKYTRALMFWVDGEGELQDTNAPMDPKDREGIENQSPVIPPRWNAADSIAFMKRSTNGNLFTVVSFIGDSAEVGQGFMVLQIPRPLLRDTAASSILGIIYGAVLLILFLVFAAVSWLFFARIRRRLLYLQNAMTTAQQDGFPRLIQEGRPDEIGKLEEAFNTMVTELKDSRRRELAEENLRKRLISDLSHDLRTPLTVIRSHVYNLGKESISEEGKRSLRLMDERIADLGVLIDNLLSYNLLTSGKVELNLERLDVVRLLRESAAAWYPLWEKEGFETEVELAGGPLYWELDEVWFRRVLDNLYQNILRHAHDGSYVGVATELRNGVRVIVISDHGRGIDSDSGAKGAGLGLSIVDLLLTRMNLKWEVNSSGAGTLVVIFPSRP
jgi:signal transduction histidine kinase